MLVFPIAAAIAQDAGPALITQCTSPSSCTTLNVGPCGSLLTTYLGTLSVEPPSASIDTPGTHGFCGFINSPPMPGAIPSGPGSCQSTAECSSPNERCVNNVCVVTSGGFR
jgi:hypothetical protein